MTIVFPEPLHCHVRFSPKGYPDGKFDVKFTLDQADDGTITIHREKSGNTEYTEGLIFGGERKRESNFDNHTTDIIISPVGNSIKIEHMEKKMIPEWRYQFEAPDHNEIGALAKEILAQGVLDEATAKKLSQRIDLEIAGCRRKEIGHIIRNEGGWIEAFKKFQETRSATAGRG